MDVSSSPPAASPVRVLVTGFGPFGHFQVNPSWQSAERLHASVLDECPRPLPPREFAGCSSQRPPPPSPDSFCSVAPGSQARPPRSIEIQSVQIPVSFRGVLERVPQLYGLEAWTSNEWEQECEWFKQIKTEQEHRQRAKRRVGTEMAEGVIQGPCGPTSLVAAPASVKRQRNRGTAGGEDGDGDDDGDDDERRQKRRLSQTRGGEQPRATLAHDTYAAMLQEPARLASDAPVRIDADFAPQLIIHLGVGHPSSLKIETRARRWGYSTLFPDIDDRDAPADHYPHLAWLKSRSSDTALTLDQRHNGNTLHDGQTALSLPPITRRTGLKECQGRDWKELFAEFRQRYTDGLNGQLASPSVKSVPPSPVKRGFPGPDWDICQSLSRARLDEDSESRDSGSEDDAEEEEEAMATIVDAEALEWYLVTKMNAPYSVLSSDAGRYMCEFIYFCSMACSRRRARLLASQLTPISFNSFTRSTISPSPFLLPSALPLPSSSPSPLHSSSARHQLSLSTSTLTSPTQPLDAKVNENGDVSNGSCSVRGSMTQEDEDCLIRSLEVPVVFLHVPPENDAYTIDELVELVKGTIWALVNEGFAGI